MPNYVPGKGSISPKLLICGEAPGRYEDESGEPFVGPSGQQLDIFLKNAGTSRNECWITNVVKYRPPMNDLKKLHLIDVDLEQQIQELWDKEINVLRPNVILAVGDTALRATTGFSGILNYRGSILLARNGTTKVVPTIHPAALMHSRSDKADDNTAGALDYVYSKLIQADIRRAVEESSTARYDLPDRDLVVCHDSLELFRFFNSYKELNRAAVDIESFNCVPICIGFAFNRHHAISVPLLKQIGGVQLTSMAANELSECWKLIAQELPRLEIIGHNFKYDEFKLGLIGFETPNVISDTLLKTRVIFPELPDKRLSTVASLWTREPYYKDEGKEFKLGKSPINQILKYNAKDCAVEFEVDEEQEKDLIELGEFHHIPLKEYYYGYMMKKHKFYLAMENVGFRVDHERQKSLLKTYKQLELEAHNKLIDLVGHEVNVKSPPQIFSLLYKEMKFPVYKSEPTSEDTIVKLLGNHAKKPLHKAILEGILEERRIRDQKSRYISFCPDYDGRCKTSFNISATETCRSSTSVLKKPLRPKKIGLAFHTISKHGRLAKHIRSMFIPDPGKVFIQADSSQAEARVVAVLAEDYELLAAFDKVDIHRRTAGLIFGLSPSLNLNPAHLPIVDEIDKDSSMRFTGKIARHAGNYDMGKRRLMTEFNTLAQKFEISDSISEWRAGKILELFHSASPKLRGVFHRDIKEALHNNRTIIDPFGGLRVFNGRMDDELYKEGYANIPQRTVAHLVQGAALKIAAELNGDSAVAFISENHDSLLLQAPANNWLPYAKLMKEHMETPIDFSTYCTLRRDYTLTIPCELEMSDTNYAELLKVKL